MKDYNLKLLISLLIISLSNLATGQSSVSLFNGKDLSGWHKVGGTGQFTVEDGVIRGHSIDIKDNTFLTTKKTYDNFILELEARFDMDELTNSGIQFRSHAIDNRLRGYQFEFDNGATTSNTGAVWDEYGTRGFIAPFIPLSWIHKADYKELMQKHGEAVKTFQTNTASLLKKRDWNTIKIHCQDGRVQTWLNGVKQTDFTDPKGVGYKSGLIGLQLHSGKRCEVSWRNIQITPLQATTNTAASTVSDDKKEVLTADQLAYLDKLMRDTFRFMHEAADPETGLTGNHKGDYSFVNSTPIGLHIASLAIGSELGLIDKDEAAAKFEKVLDTMEKIHFKQDGFFPNFINRDLSTKFNSVMVISDYNFYPVGMVVARQVWPQYEKRISKYLDSIKWNKLYNKTQNRVIAGYDLSTKKAAYEGLWLASDARCALMMMVGAGAAPGKVWEGQISSKMNTAYGPINTPGMNFGGTYIAGITGLFMHESDLVNVGSTVGNMGWFQYKFSRKRNYPLWGWSNSFIVGRNYSSAGMIPEWNVTPHALSMLLEYYPRHVTAALQKMTKMGGQVPPKGYEGKEWGLLGCYDMERNLWGDYYLSLEQGMMFIGLANFLHDDIAKKLFTQDPIVKKGMEISAPYLKRDPKLLKRWATRDAEPIKETRIYQKSPWEPAIETVTQLDLSKIKSNNPDFLKVTQEKGLAIIKGHGDWKAASIAIPTNPLDIAKLDRVEFEFESFKGNKTLPENIRFQLTDKFGQSRWTYLTLQPNGKSYSVKARDIYCFTFDDIIESASLVFERESWFYHNALFHSNNFTLRIKAIRIITK